MHLLIQNATTVCVLHETSILFLERDLKLRFLLQIADRPRKRLLGRSFDVSHTTLSPVFLR